MAAVDDVAASIGVPELVPQAPAPQPPPSAQPPPQGTPGGLDPRVVWTIGGEAASDAPGRRAVASVVRNRLAAGAPDPVSVVSEPGQFAAYGSIDQTAKRFPVGSPQYQALESQIAPIISGAQPPTVPYTGFRTHGYVSPGAPWNGSSPVATIGGNDFATVPYKYSGGPGAAQSVAASIGLTPDEQKALAGQTGAAPASQPGAPTTSIPQPPAVGPSGAGGAFASLGNFNAGGPQGPMVTAPQPSTPAGRQPATQGDITWGPSFAKPTAAAYKTFSELNGGKGPDTNADAGSAALPYYAAPGTQFSQRPGDHWVDADGVHHVNPGGMLDKAGFSIAGALQGLGLDTAASGSRMTAGGIAVDNPLYAALGQGMGGPGAFDIASAAQQGFRNQQANYAAATRGQPTAQTGRFLGQAAPAVAASAAAPEIELPNALGGVGKVVATGLNNALRGVAATAPSVGANAAPVTQQLLTGAAGGLVAPVVEKAVTAPVAAVTGFGRTVSPEVAALADAAQTKYGIPLRSGQVMGANGDRAAATADSNMLGSDAKVLANNQAQRQAFMKGMTGTYGDASGDVSPTGLSAARAQVVAPMNDIAARTNIPPPVADAVQTRLGQIISDAQKVLPDNEVAPLLNMVQSIGDVRNPNGISGESYQALTRQNAPLDRLESSDNSNVAHYASQIHDALNDGLAASASPDDIAALSNARFQYKNLMTVAKLAPKADAQGVISPALLRGAVGTQFKQQAFQGAGDLGELAQIGQTFMKEPPNSFTANRANDLLQTGLLGLATGGAADIGLGLLHQPEKAIPTGVSALAGTGVKLAADAIKRNKVGGSAAGIVSRSLGVNPPGSALAGIGGAIGQGARSLEIPLSALAGVRLGGMVSSPPTPIGNPHPAIAP